MVSPNNTFSTIWAVSVLVLALVPASYFMGINIPSLDVNFYLFGPTEAQYSVQVFSTDPTIIYIRDFVSKDEIKYLLSKADGKYNTSRVWTDEVGFIDTTIRDSESAVVKSDVVVKRIMKRARSLIGWRNNDTHLQPMTLQRYEFNGFFTFHYDWVDDSGTGNRMTTFMVYLVDKCTGGGTNFPRLQAPGDLRWCDIIACKGDVEHEEYPGVTFKPIAGSAVYWDNFHPNGTPHTGTRHAALPVRSGEKVGMNIWSWDNSWRPPVAEMDDEKKS